MAENLDSEACNHMINGKRHLLIRDYYSAVQSFEKVCQLLDNKYGKCSDHCGDAYLNYGIALLELARQETGANEGLVNAKINDPSGSDEEEDEGDYDDEEGKEKEAEKTDFEEDLAVSDEEQDDKSKEVDSSIESSEIKSVETSLAPVDSSAGPCNGLDEPSTSTGIKRSDDDEPTNTEIAWEVLSIAKEIFTRQVTKGEDVKFKLAETLQKLGEIATEWENNELAIELLTECLNLRQQSLPEDDRLIAETHYHIGNAHSFLSQIDAANDCLQKAIDVIKKRIDNKKIACLDATKDEETLSSIRDEIRELEDLLPEMVARIEDRADQMMATIKDAVKMACLDKEDEETAAKVKTTETKPVNNISHLVKRKHVDNGGDSSTSSNGCTKKICLNDHQAKKVEKTDTHK